jgi:arsenite methyltransferase
VSGALAERVFAEKLHRAGFVDVWVGGHLPFGIEDAARYPLFTPDVIEVMRRTIPLEHQDHVATGVIIKARKPDQ